MTRTTEAEVHLPEGGGAVANDALRIPHSFVVVRGVSYEMTPCVCNTYAAIVVLLHVMERDAVSVSM